MNELEIQGEIINELIDSKITTFKYFYGRGPSVIVISSYYYEILNIYLQENYRKFGNYFDGLGNLYNIKGINIVKTVKDIIEVF